jgi:hypothetical protein
MKDFQPQRGCAIFALRNQQTPAQPLCGCAIKYALFPKVAAQRGNPGLEVVAPVGQRKPQRLVSFHTTSVADVSHGTQPRVLGY